jgi:hypothetical protein
MREVLVNLQAALDTITASLKAGPVEGHCSFAVTRHKDGSALNAHETRMAAAPPPAPRHMLIPCEGRGGGVRTGPARQSPAPRDAPDSRGAHRGRYLTDDGYGRDRDTDRWSNSGARPGRCPALF